MVDAFFVDSLAIWRDFVLFFDGHQHQIRDEKKKPLLVIQITSRYMVLYEIVQSGKCIFGAAHENQKKINKNLIFILCVSVHLILSLNVLFSSDDGIKKIIIQQTENQIKCKYLIRNGYRANLINASGRGHTRNGMNHKNRLEMIHRMHGERKRVKRNVVPDEKRNNSECPESMENVLVGNEIDRYE